MAGREFTTEMRAFVIGMSQFSLPGCDQPANRQEEPQAGSSYQVKSLLRYSFSY